MMEGVQESGVRSMANATLCYQEFRSSGVRKREEERRKKNLEAELVSLKYLKPLTLSLRFFQKNIYQHHY